ncbi:MAG: hypothetical protein ACLU8S_03150 [Coprococcus phoceensis]
MRAFGREKRKKSVLIEANEHSLRTMLFTNRVMTFMMPLVTLIVMCGINVLIVWVAAHKIDSGSMQVGAMTAFITYAMQIVMSFLIAHNDVRLCFQGSGLRLDRIDEVLNEKSSIRDLKILKALEGHKRCCTL